MERKRHHQPRINPGTCLRNLTDYQHAVFALFHTVQLALKHDLIAPEMKEDMERDMKRVGEFMNIE